MYIEQKISGDDTGPARIGRVVFSKTGRTLYSAGKAFQSLKGSGIGGDYADVETGEEYWISERVRLVLRRPGRKAATMSCWAKPPVACPSV